MTQDQWEDEIRKVSVQFYDELLLDEPSAIAAGIPPSAIIRAMYRGVISDRVVLVDP